MITYANLLNNVYGAVCLNALLVSWGCEIRGTLIINWFNIQCHMGVTRKVIDPTEITHKLVFKNSLLELFDDNKMAVLTTPDANSDEDFVKMIPMPFQWKIFNSKDIWIFETIGFHFPHHSTSSCCHSMTDGATGDDLLWDDIADLWQTLGICHCRYWLAFFTH